MHYTMLVSRLAMAVAITGISQPALAQATDNDATTGGVEEIVVTAQKREQRLQDVPITVSALSGAGAEARGIQSTEELSTAVPSLDWQAGKAGSPYIRGIGSIISTAGNESSVGLFVDGVLLISPLQANFNLNNVERVEVLKGPQGTLFGRNANGGVINIITLDPSQETKVDASLGYGNYDTVDAQFYGNVGLTDTLAANVAVAYRNQMDGWGKNVITGADAYDGDSFDIRAKLGWSPTPETDIILTGQYFTNHNEATKNRLLRGTVGTNGALPPPGFYDVNESFESFTETDVWSVNLRVTHDFGAATFRSLTAYTDVDTLWAYDSDAGPLVTLDGDIFENASGFTQEFQLLSPAEQSVRWIVGLYYLDMEAAFTPIELEGTSVGGAFVEVFGHTRARSLAGFGEVTFELAPTTHLTLGGRYTFDKRTVDGHTDVNGNPGVVSYQQKNFSEPTYRVTLDHKFTDDVMAYATVSTGYNSGQFNTGNARAPAVKPEKMQAYEVGIKSNLLDRRLQLNAAAFWYDYKDLQVNIVREAVTVQTNAAKARVKGFEIELNAAPVDNLSLQFAFSYLDSEYTKYADAQFYIPNAGGGYTTIVGDASGNQMINAPKYSGFAYAQYEIKTDIGSFTPGLSYAYKSKIYRNYQNNLVSPSQNLVNASLLFTPASGSWDVRLWGKNLLDEKNEQKSVRLEGAMGRPFAPLTYGVTLGLHF
ncbi:TonB-dependent receptor [Sphingosinicella microcystinivorans]|uniref:TonB-dependent receptor n=1 Tax=Sphingosinicella microcystinivorans TaxID=335406 RepID=UPI0022F4031C|nr:TonB-dependent receptor [Sphingosinicella microcystinivorans]WBX85778.1 TonB-dependent receptor [Sphingosinicella microcystinivorans]